MRLLILGGTGFVGRAIVDDAMARGWEVTVFNRGTREPPVGARALRGDRTTPTGLTALRTGAWDLAVDTWSGAPRVVRDAAELLADRVARYVYVSSCSVYAFPSPVGAEEDADVVDGDPDAGDVAYANAKRGAELAVERAFGDRHLHVRAGLILGPWEDIGRLPWWLVRIARGGPVLAPGPREAPLQYIDTRDLAAWVADAGAAGLTGAYNAVGPVGHTTMGELLDLCVRVTGSNAELRWTDPDALLAAGVEPWTELPVWLPAGVETDSMFRIGVERIRGAGLRVRPTAETVADTWTWLREIGGTAPQRPDRPILGLAPKKEARLLRT